tara:strand:- start:10753 stop:11589 length:837 start_codon:yes stop_codon:yes gene_type:complete
MEMYDLDLVQYSLSDLLNLFDMSLPMSELDLFNAKKKAYLTHPDKSGASPEVFVFFKAAYDKLNDLFLIQRRMSRESAEEYECEMQEKNAGLEVFSKRSDFGAMFNDLFENHVASVNKTEGHGVWLSETTDAVDATTATELELRKKETRMLSAVVEIQGWSNGQCGSDLLENTTSSFGNGGLAFEDVKKAYTESIIPVTEEDDFERRHRCSSVDEIMKHRQQDINGDAFDGHEAMLREQRKKNDMQDVEMAYKLQRQDHTLRTAGAQVKSSLLQICGK